MYITYQRIGTGHCDATIETHQEPIALPSENVHNQYAAVGCRCGRGNAKNKQERTFL